MLSLSAMQPQITFKPLQEHDLPKFFNWLRADHVKKWWRDEYADLTALKKAYIRNIAGTDPTRVFVIMLGKKPIGILQSEWIKDYPDYEKLVEIADGVGLDILIGEKEYTGKGLGPKIIRQFIKGSIPGLYSGAKSFIASPSMQNKQSIRAFEKAGFWQIKTIIIPSERDPKQLMELKVDLPSSRQLNQHQNEEI